MPRPRRVASASLTVGLVAAFVVATAGPAGASTAGINGSTLVFTARWGRSTTRRSRAGPAVCRSGSRTSGR
ncbi:MAG TPA: hypothetical protein VKA30_08390 [Actinomycetota bacterium]|nr:hypothetical protein [Actinomycetota bacterium]